VTQAVDQVPEQPDGRKQLWLKQLITAVVAVAGGAELALNLIPEVGRLVALTAMLGVLLYRVSTDPPDWLQRSEAAFAVSVTLLTGVTVPLGAVAVFDKVRPPHTTADAAVTLCSGDSVPCETRVETLPKGAPLTMVCYENASWRGRDRRFFYVEQEQGVQGFVVPKVVDHQDPSPHCDTLPWMAATNRLLKSQPPRPRVIPKDGSAPDPASGTSWTLLRRA